MLMKTRPHYLSLSHPSIPNQVLAYFSSSPDDPFYLDITSEKEHPARKKGHPLTSINFLEFRVTPNFENASFGPLDLYISKIRIVKDPSLENVECETLIVTVQRTPQHAGYDLDVRISWELVFFRYQRITPKITMYEFVRGVYAEQMIDLLDEDDEDDVKILQQPSIAEVSFNTPHYVPHSLDLEGRLAQAKEFEFQPTHTTAAIASLSQDDAARPPLYFMSFLLLLESLILLPGEAVEGFHKSAGSFWLSMKLFDTVTSMFGIPQTIRVNDRSWYYLFTWFFNMSIWFFNPFRRPETASDPRPPGTIGPFNVMERPSPDDIYKYLQNWADANDKFKSSEEFTLYMASLQAKIEETKRPELRQESPPEGVLVSL